jgi:hypothetical protein
MKVSKIFAFGIFSIMALSCEKNNRNAVFIRGEGLIPCGSAAVIEGLNPSPTPQENNIPRGSAPGLLIENSHMELSYNALIEYLKISRKEICEKNYHKGIEALYLLDEQKEFYNSRLDYFIAIISEDEISKEQYYNRHFEYSQKFTQESIDLFYSSKDIFDYYLFDKIERKFDGIKFPIRYLKEYHMDYRMMINQKNIKD